MDTVPNTQVTLVGAETGPVPGTLITRSPIYAEDGPYVFKVGNRLFRFPTMWNLVRISDVFAGLIDTGGKFTDSRDGRDDEHAIELAGDNPDDFEALAGWMFQLAPATLSTEQWLGVLALSTKYMISTGVEQAVGHIDNLRFGASLQNCYKLRIAWQFGVDKWINQCLNSILYLPYYCELSADDISDLEPPLAAKVIRTRSLVMQHRLDMIPFTPEVRHHAAFCLDHAACAKNWKAAYRACVVQFAYSNANFLHGDVILEKLREMQIDGMHADCLVETLSEVQSGFTREAVIIEEAKLRIKELLRDTAPCSPRPHCRNGYA